MIIPYEDDNTPTGRWVRDNDPDDQSPTLVYEENYTDDALAQSRWVRERFDAENAVQIKETNENTI